MRHVERWWKSYCALGAMVPVLALALGCATIIHGTRQKIKISSVPEGATVYLDGVQQGKTPLTARVKRKDKKHKIRIEMAGYEPFTATLERKFSGWYIGNLAFGGIIGFIVDPVNGAMYKMVPKQIEAQLHKRVAELLEQEDTIYVGMSPYPDPAWEKIVDLVPTVGE